MHPTPRPDVDDPADILAVPPGPKVDAGAKDDGHRTEENDSRQVAWDSFFNSPRWRFLLMPLVTNTVPIVVATYWISATIKNTEFADRVRAVGITAQVDIIRSDHALLRDLAIKLRRFHAEIDQALVGRAAGDLAAHVSPDTLGLIRSLDDALHFISILDDRSRTRPEEDAFTKAIADARTFAGELHACLAPDMVSDDVRATCAATFEKYRRLVPPAARPSLALHLVDNALLALRRQLRQ